MSLGSIQTFFERDSEVFFLGLFVLALGWLLVKRRRAGLVVLAAVAVAGVLAVVLGGEDAPSEETKAAWRRLDAAQEEVHNRVAAAVRERRLPPQALEMFPRHGEHEPDIVPRPDGDGDAKDVIPGLRWDLDGNGRITRSERRITEYELWSAALAGGRERPRKHEPAPAEEEGLREA